MSANTSEGVKTSANPSTAGFAGITLNPAPYISAAASVILAAVADGSNGANKAQVSLVMGPLPYVVITAAVGSPFNLRTGGTTNTLSQQNMIQAMGCTPGAFTALLWNAVANFLFNNPIWLHADGFQTALPTRSNGASILDILP